MAGTLIIAEHLRGQLRDITRECVTAAAALDGPVAVAVVARDPAAIAAQANVSGVDENSSDAYVNAAEALVAAKQPTVVLTGFTVSAMAFAPALAARLGLGFASDVIAIRNESGLVAEREMYGAKVRAELEFPGKETTVLMLRGTTWQPAEGAGSASVSELAASIPPSRSHHREFVEAAAGDVDITKAEFLLSVGRGVGEKDNIEQFEELAGKMGATLGVSRPLVDAGWMPASRQVGQSGKTV